MSNFPLDASVYRRLSLGFFHRTAESPVVAPPEPDPFAADRAPALYYLGGRAGVWRSPTLYGRTQVSQQQAGYGCDSGARDLTLVGLACGQVVSGFAPVTTFTNPTGVSDSNNPRNLGSYGIGVPFRLINTWAEGAGQHFYNFTLTDTVRLQFNNTISSSVSGVTCNVNLSGQDISCEYNLSTNSTNLTNYANLSGNSSSGGVTWQLAAGTYTLWLVRYDSEYGLPNWPAGSSYNLDFTFTAPPPPAPGATLAAAMNLGNQTAGVALGYSGSMLASESNHYFKFKAVGTGNRTITLTGLSCDYDVTLLTSGGSYIVDSAHGGTSNESMTRNLTGGTTYVVKVVNYPSAAGTYVLTIT